MNKFRGSILLIAAVLAIYFAVTRMHGLQAVITGVLGLLVGGVGVVRIVQK